jgi:hypothetical protein
MFEHVSRQDRSDERLFSNMLAEVRCIEELVVALESESVTIDDAIGLISGIQRDIVQLYRAAA